MGNSSLVSYTLISPNKTKGRKHAIDTISIHCMAGQLSVESCGKLFYNKKTQASSNYGIGPDGRVGLYVEECDRSWCTSSSSNDNRAITIEVASDSKAPYAVKPAAYNTLITLLVDICKRNNIKQLLWKADKNLIGQVDKQNMTVHRWFAKKACPGDYLYNLHGQIAAQVNQQLGGVTPTPQPIPQPTVQVAVHTVKNGSKGANAKLLQQNLTACGYKLAADGIFGAKSVAALKKWQTANKLTADGIYGIKSEAKMKQILQK